jgi:formylglycine-generating enzyme required for sulfatase activity
MMRQNRVDPKTKMLRVCCVLAISLLAAGVVEPEPFPGGPEAVAGAEPLPGMVLIPAGEFQMGKEDGGDNGPVHTVSLDAFYLDSREVTNAEYEAFCQATEHRLPQFWGMAEFHCGPEFPNHPVVGVSLYDATDYAEWAGKRIPTEAEWEYAARGGLVDQPYPHGAELDRDHVNYKSEGTQSVGSYPANGYGLYDMSGNVVEWVSDRYDADYYANSPRHNPTGPEKGRFCVIRGGGWFSGPGCVSVDHRNALPPNWVDFNVGFRCAKDVDGSSEEVGSE